VLTALLVSVARVALLWGVVTVGVAPMAVVATTAATNCAATALVPCR
jgi:hypothetical protein